MYDLSKNNFINYGININGEVTLDLSKMMSNKESVVKKLTGGISSLFKKNNVTYLTGTAKLSSSNAIEVNNEIYESKTILIATGSIPSTIKNVDVDEEDIVSSTGALNFKKVPKDLAVIGGGYIGLELGSVWKRS